MRFITNWILKLRYFARTQSMGSKWSPIEKLYTWETGLALSIPENVLFFLNVCQTPLWNHIRCVPFKLLMYPLFNLWWIEKSELSYFLLVLRKISFGLKTILDVSTLMMFTNYIFLLFCVCFTHVLSCLFCYYGALLFTHGIGHF